MPNLFNDIPNPKIPSYKEFVELNDKIEKTAVLDGRSSTQKFSEAILTMTSLDFYKLVYYYNNQVYLIALESGLKVGRISGKIKGFFFASLFWIVIYFCLKYYDVI